MAKHSASAPDAVDAMVVKTMQDASGLGPLAPLVLDQLGGLLEDPEWLARARQGEGLAALYQSRPWTLGGTEPRPLRATCIQVHMHTHANT
eukprot:8091413-Alexandrium_andersonii.AAC.1